MALDRARYGLVRAWRYYRREGARSLVRRAAQEVPVGRLRRDGGPGLPPAIREHRARTVQAHIDVPRKEAWVTDDLLTVSGWALAESGVGRVDLHLDGRLAGSTVPDLDRPDVSDLQPNVPGAATCGFAAEVEVADLSLGAHLLQVVVHGTDESVRVVSRSFQRVDPESLYDIWYHRMRPTRDHASRAVRSSRARGRPAVHLVVTAGEDNLLGTLRSLADQELADWTCAVVGARPGPAPGAIDLLGLGALAERIRPAGDLVEALEGPAGRWVGFLAAGEQLAPHALALLGSSGHDPSAEVRYADHDLVDGYGRHHAPRFAPRWSPDHLLGRDYVGGFFLARDGDRLREAVAHAHAGGPAWRYDLLLRLTDQPVAVDHVPRVLWSAPVAGAATGAASTPASVTRREARPGPATGVRDDAPDGEREAVGRALERRAAGAVAQDEGHPGVRRIRWQVEGRPTVSIIIPTTGRLEVLQPCLASIRARTAWPAYELLVIDNGRGRHPEGIAWARDQGVPILERDEPFNWAKLNNDGARATGGELLLFLNDDIEVGPDAGWLEELVSHAMRSDVGTVGALLLYPDGTIQHAGVVMVSHGGGAMHLLRGLDPDGRVHGDLHRVTREVSANTGACLMVRRSVFEEAGGFDESLAVVGNDVDLCLRLLSRGYRNLWTPHAVLTHHESISRGATHVSGDEATLRARWRRLLSEGDPYHNPNLATDRPDCAVAWDRMPPAGTAARTGQLPEGVNLVGYLRAEMGLGEAVRGEAAALEAAGVPFVGIDYTWGNPARMGDDTLAGVMAAEPRYDVTLLHVNADLTGAAVARLPREVFAGRYTIGYWAWELPEFPDEWLHAFRLVDEVWVPSSFVQDAVARKSPVPVVRIPHAIRPRTGPFLDRGEFGLQADPWQVVTFVDVNSVRARKNPDAAIAAFLDAFPPTDRGVSLVIKVNGATPEQADAIRALAGDRAQVRTIDRTLTRHEVDSLIAGSDCLLSLHRSEGFGLPIAEAMSMGKPVVATYWSGNVDFMSPANAACVGYWLVRVGSDQGPYKAHQTWAEPDVEEAARWLRRLRDDPDLGRRMGAAARATIERQHSPAAVGAVIAQRLRIIRQLRRRG